jgi:lipid II:glycine glycyltransferase (peptidoglycan interpeptide bridge formation enzyme)
MAPLIEGRNGAAASSDWDQLLAPWPWANLLQSRGWGEVQGRAGWRTHRVLIETREGPLPVTVLLTKTGIPGITRLYVPRGPVCSPDDFEAFEQVRSRLRDLGRSCAAAVVDLELPWPSETLPAGHPVRGLQPIAAHQPLATSIVDLRPAPETILASFHAKTRYNVRLAERRGVQVREVTLAELSRCVRATEARQRIHLPSDVHLGHVRACLGQAASLLGAVVEDEVVSAVLLARFGSQVVYLYGGSTERHRQSMPNHLLHWRAMMQARKEGCESYDLWGVPEEDRADHPWHGLDQFKRGFGGTRVEYAGCWRDQLRPLGHRLVDLADLARSRVRRGR